MADNTIQNGTDTIATDDLAFLNGGAVSGFKVQRVKAGWGIDGTQTDVTAATPLPVQALFTTSGTGTPTAPSVTAASTLALASNAARKGATFFNDSNVDVLLASGFTATVTAYTVRLLANGGYYELPYSYTGLINMVGVTANTTTVAAAGSGGIRVTEFT